MTSVISRTGVNTEEAASAASLIIVRFRRDTVFTTQFEEDWDNCLRRVIAWQERIGSREPMHVVLDHRDGSLLNEADSASPRL
jgi:hypothetical protein